MDGLTETKVMKIVTEALDRFENNYSLKHPVNNGIQGWRRTGIIVLVLAAIATPILTVLWQASERVSQLDNVTSEVQELREDFKDMRLREIADLRKEVRELREIVIRMDRNVQIPGLRFPSLSVVNPTEPASE